MSDKSTDKLTLMRNFRVSSPGVSLGLLAAFFVFFLILAGILMPFLQGIFKKPEAAIRIMALLQDIFIFIIPAIGVAMLSTKLPARLLAVDSLPSVRMLITAVATLIFSIPVMNYIIEWNQGWHLPESMHNAEQYFRHLEDNASTTINLLLNGASVFSIIVSVLIVGVMAGFSEELFFRGALQRLLGMTSLRHHAAIWITAFIFSAFHFQLFGFVPRLLLGAFFGYTLWWSGSLWLPILLHILNNSLVVVAETVNTGQTAELSKVGSQLTTPTEIVFFVLSIILTTFGLYLLHRQSKTA